MSEKVKKSPLPRFGDLSRRANELAASLAPRIREFLLTLPDHLRRMPEYAGRARAAFLAYVADLSVSRRSRFVTVLWALVIMFVGFFTLVGTNPFRLLVPGTFFYPPVVDSRDLIEIYGVDRNTGELTVAARPLHLSSAPEERAVEIAHAISRPTGLQEARSGRHNANLEPLPDFGLAIRKAWYNEEQQGLVLDLRAATIEEELERFFQGREDGEGNTPNHAELVNAYFRALTASLFAVSSELRRVEFLIDGKRAELRGQSFDFSKRYVRQG